MVDRLYYSERILEGSTIFSLGFTAVNLLYIQKNYFANIMRPRIPKVWKYWAIGNAVTLFLLLRPLTKEEITIQWRKRLVMGKWLYTLGHFDPVDTSSHKAPQH